MVDKPTLSGKELQSEKEKDKEIQQLKEQLNAIGKELESERQRDKEKQQLKEQLEAIGKELQSQRDQNKTLARKLENSQQKLPDNDEIASYIDRTRLIIIPEILNILGDSDNFVVVDAGAREVDRDIRWKPFPSKNISFFGFEADTDEANRLNNKAKQDGLTQRYFPAGLWSKSGKQTFEHNHAPGGSSFIPQNRKVTDRWKFENPNEFQNAVDIFFPEKTEDLKVVTLDDFARAEKIKEIDFLKINVQGGEHEILKGAAKNIGSILGLFLEVSFVESYKNRPLFSDTDVFLREKGFTFFDLLAHHYIGRADSPVEAQHLLTSNPNLGLLVSAWGQLVEGHALYLLDPIASDNPLQLSPRRVLKLAALSEAWGQIEYAFELMNWLKEREDVVQTNLCNKLELIIKRTFEGYSRLSNKGARPNV